MAHNLYESWTPSAARFRVGGDSELTGWLKEAGKHPKSRNVSGGCECNEPCCLPQPA